MITTSHARRAAVAAALVGLVTGCDNPVAVEEHEEEPFGVVLLDGTTAVASAIGTEIEGVIQVPVGSATQPLTIAFVAEDGDVLDLEPDDHQVQLQVQDAAIASVLPSDPAGFQARLEGESVGTTFVRVVLLHAHDEEFEVEWFSGWIPVTVTAAGP